MNKNKLLALDGDGVIFDYRKAFPVVWKAAFGDEIEMVAPNSYHAHTAYGISWESDEQKNKFFEHFETHAWATMPLMDGADEACKLLKDAGYKLIIVSSMNPTFSQARADNCKLFDLPIDDVIAVKRVEKENPKLAELHRLKPAALVDDLIDNFEGLDPVIHAAFINYQRIDCPSREHHIAPDSSHGSLLEFAHHWISRM
jgi:phosphoglycolate phosphatase-like HAD superfamily hydrolase